jgi:hypothetical protein
VAETFGNDLGVNVLFQKQCRMGMPQIVKANVGKVRFLNQLFTCAGEIAAINWFAKWCTVDQVEVVIHACCILKAFLQDGLNGSSLEPDFRVCFSGMLSLRKYRRIVT